jgi:hypothetical protein
MTADTYTSTSAVGGMDIPLGTGGVEEPRDRALL